MIPPQPDLHAERLAATADLRGERQKVLDALSGQEGAIVSDMRATSEKEIQIVNTKGRDLIDHLFLRALELMLLTLVLFSLVAWFLLRALCVSVTSAFWPIAFALPVWRWAGNCWPPVARQSRK